MDRNEVLKAIEKARQADETPDLRGANLRGADLHSANLNGANLRGADLRGVNLNQAHLSGAYLSYANLSYANLSYADLSHSNLYCANLYGADLRGADLSRADLNATDLSHADLSYADLSHSNLYCANLHGARGWEGLQITGLHRYEILLTPTPDQWEITIGCWTGTPNDLATLIAQGNDWPESTGEAIPRNRRLLEAALVVIYAHIAAHPHTRGSQRRKPLDNDKGEEHA